MFSSYDYNKAPSNTRAMQLNNYKQYITRIVCMKIISIVKKLLRQWAQKIFTSQK